MRERRLGQYDFAAWRTRLGLSKREACDMLDVSQSTWWRMESSGFGAKSYMWACYGIEQYLNGKK